MPKIIIQIHQSSVLLHQLQALVSPVSTPHAPIWDAKTPRTPRTGTALTLSSWCSEYREVTHLVALGRCGKSAYDLLWAKTTHEAQLGAGSSVRRGFLCAGASGEGKGTETDWKPKRLVKLRCFV